MPNGARTGVPYPSLADPADVPSDLQDLVARLESVMALVDQGSLGARPAAGTRGKFYFETSGSILYYDTGTSWVSVNSGAPADGPAATPSLRTLGSGAQQAASGADGRLSDTRVPTDGSVTSAKVATSLKPSSGAGAGTEALRSLGTNVGQAAAGSHASQHASGGADPLTAGALNVDVLKANPYAMFKSNGNEADTSAYGGSTISLTSGVAQNVPWRVSTAFPARGGLDSMFNAGDVFTLTIPTSALYSIHLVIRHATGGTGTRYAKLLIGGVDVAYDWIENLSAVDWSQAQITWVQYLTAGTTVKAQAAQFTGSPKAFDARMTVHRVGS